jgi:prevent-host-death family protein
MPSRSSSFPPADRPKRSSRLAPAWRLEEAKARFSEVVRLAREAGPQHVTVRGRDAVVILSAEDYARLAPAATAPTLAALFGTGPFARLDSFEAGVVREQPAVRDAIEF